MKIPSKIYVVFDRDGLAAIRLNKRETEDVMGCRAGASYVMRTYELSPLRQKTKKVSK